MTEKMPEVVWLRSRRDTAWWWSWYEEKQGADDIPYVPESRVVEAEAEVERLKREVERLKLCPTCGKPTNVIPECTKCTFSTSP